MNTARYHTPVSLSGGRRVFLVLACAWCPKEKYPPLKKNEEYTHGICREHKQKILKDFKVKVKH